MACKTLTFNVLYHKGIEFNVSVVDTFCVIFSPESVSCCLKDEMVVSDSDPDPVYNWWIKALGLHKSDQDALRSGDELTENVINAAQAILNSQFQQIYGFQDTALVHFLNFLPVSPDKPSVQILHTGVYICQQSLILNVQD